MGKWNGTYNLTDAAVRCIRLNPWLDEDEQDLVIEVMARKVGASIKPPRFSELDDQLDLALALDG